MKKLWSAIFSILIIIESLIVSCDQYSRSISNQDSTSRTFLTTGWIILFGVLLLFFISLSLLINDRFRSLSWKFVSDVLDNPKWLVGILFILFFAIYESFQDYLFLRATLPSIYFQFYRHVVKYFSVLCLMFIGSIQFLLLIFILQWSSVKTWLLTTIKASWIRSFAILIFIFALLDFSGYGYDNSTEDFIKPFPLNAPLLGIQVILLVCFLLMAGWLFVRVFNNRPSIKKVLQNEFVIIIGLWLLAFILWSNTPLWSDYFIDIPRAPNFAIYPTSDQLIYDIQAQDLLVGGGMKTNILHSDIYNVQHPMHSFFLAVLHRIAGAGYQDILVLQIAIFSFMPILIYKIGSLIHTRFSGFLIGILFILRERNGLFLGDYINGSNVKTLMTEPLTLLGFLLFIYLFLTWMLKKDQKTWLIMICGGIFGFIVLIRIEILAMLPALGLITFIHFKGKWSAWIRSSMAATLAIVIMITPWMVRNYLVEGRFEIDKSNQIRWIIKNYRDFFFPNEEPVESIQVVPNDKSQTRITSGNKVASLVKNTGVFDTAVYQYESHKISIPDHFVNNLQQTIYYLPNNHQPFLTIGSIKNLSLQNGGEFSERYLERYVKSLPYWGFEWDGKLAPRSYLPLIISIGMISIGLSQIKRDKFIINFTFGLLLVTHSLAYALAAGSGGRRIIIIDWIPLVYYGIGISIIVSQLFFRLFGNGPTSADEEVSTAVDIRIKDQGSRWGYLTLAGILCIGLLLPLTDMLLPTAYTEPGLEAQMSDLKANGININPNREKDGDVILYGKALYPRFFMAGERMEDDRRGTIPDFSYNRVEFYLVGIYNSWVALPVEAGIEYFPHGSDVIVLAEQEKEQRDPDGERIHGRYFKASTIYILDAELNNSFPVTLNCSGENCSLK